MQKFVVVGAGLAGHRAALELRDLNPDASIDLLGDESGLPYDRPPLSKEYLTDGRGLDDLVLSKAGAYGDVGIAYRPSTRVEEIDVAGCRVRDANGAFFEYDGLLLATGSTPRLLDCVEPGVATLYLRTRHDATRLREAVGEGGRIVVIGGGFIGLEVAAAAASLGCAVTLVESRERLLARSMPAFVSGYVARMHAREGVMLVLGQSVRRISPGSASPISIELDGGVLEADAVVVGTGIVPNVTLAERAGLDVADGISVDAQCRTSQAGIFAAGEVTAHPVLGRGPRRRVESWTVASRQPVVAAATMSGVEAVYDEPAWLWSDQYGVNIQSVGFPQDGTRYLLRRDEKRGGWTLFSFMGDELAGAVGVNDGRTITMLKRVMRAGGEMPAAALAGAEEVAEPEAFAQGEAARAEVE